MSDRRIITLTTDFGYRDPFVAEMKGVILSINSHTLIVDITHDVAPQDINSASYIIGSSFSYFPAGSIHVIVVDPGVGSSRRPVMLEASGHYFIGPDNGVFSHIMNLAASVRSVNITEERYMLSKESPTFQGRDLFAPAAAWLSKGIALSEFGAPNNDFVKLPVAKVRVIDGGIAGEVVYLDHFGNAVTNIKGDDVASLCGRCTVKFNGLDVRRVGYYAEADEKSLCCLVNSSGHLELFVNKGSAAREYSIKKGAKVVIAQENA
ncbi:MAG: SAM-dependent chlorinase/fluorinase [Nitrospirae bacterium]|nr:SAM-dependent chlorinase/fluorinase [Nitrospirota bacterium]